MPEGSMRLRNELGSGKGRVTDWGILPELGPIVRVD